MSFSIGFKAKFDVYFTFFDTYIITKMTTKSQEVFSPKVLIFGGF
jgi:hypothetical protein|tara:strand:- start:2083 stop:2217 length:135 start_codon:yes stop_codon:yes gene_type:complete